MKRVEYLTVSAAEAALLSEVSVVAPVPSVSSLTEYGGGTWVLLHPAASLRASRFRLFPGGGSACRFSLSRSRGQRPDSRRAAQQYKPVAHSQCRSL